MKFERYWMSGTDGLGIAGQKAYSLNSHGDPNGDYVVVLPIGEAQARHLVRRAMYYCEAPQQAAAMSAMTGRHYSVTEGGL